MRTDAIDLNLAGTNLRVLCDDPTGIAKLRHALADHLIAGPAPVGFAVRVPADIGGFHLVIDRSGHVLARLNSVDACLAVVGSHLAALLPPPPDTVRLRARTILFDDSTAALAVDPHFVSQPLVERHLQRASLRLVDRLVTDVRLDGTIVAAAPAWSGLDAMATVGGHAPAPGGPIPIESLVIPQLGPAEPSPAQLVSLLTGIMCPGSNRAMRLSLAQRLAARHVVTVPAGDTGGLYSALRR